MVGFRVVPALVVVITCSLAASAAAQDAGMRCDLPPAREPLEVTPADGAHQVSIDAPVRVLYSAGYFEPSGPGTDPSALIQLFRCPASDGCGVPCRYGEDMGEFVPGRVQVLGDDLVFFPDELWEPDHAYTGIAKGQDADLTFSFCTGTLPDTTNPEFGYLERVTSTAVGPRCDAPGGYRIAAFFPPATDGAGPPASIEYLLFQTRGAGINEPVLRSRIRNFSTAEHTMAFVLPAEQASEVICVRVVAVDGNGNWDPSDEESSVDCIDPVQGNYFFPLCAVSAPGSRGGAPIIGLALFGLAALALVVRRRR